MKFKFSILISVLFLCFVGCSSTPGELKIAEKLIETAPDSALHMLQKLPKEKYQSGESKALFGLLMIRALDKKFLPLKPDSLLDYSITYYQRNPDHERLATCYLYKGRSFKYKNLYEEALNYYLKALDIILKHENNILIGRIYLDLGEIYNIQQDYALARNKFIAAYTNFTKGKNQELAFYSMLYAGRTYYEAKDYLHADIYFRKIIPQTVDSIQKGALYQEMGLNFFDAGQLDSALIYYHEIISYPYIGNNRAFRYYLLANLYYNLNKVDSAFQYASQSFRFQPDLRTQRECYRILSNSEFIRGNMAKMSEYMNNYVHIGDSLRKIDNQTKGTYIEAMHSSKKEAAKSKSIIWFLSLIVLLIIVSSYIIYQSVNRRSNREKKQIQESHTVEKAGIRKDVADKYREVLLQKVEKQRTDLANERMKANYAQKVMIDRKIYDELLHLDQPDLFFSEMDPVLNNLATRLKTNYPSLTVKEICWCCLCLLQIPTSDIYVLLDYTVEGLKTMRKRLAQKTGLSSVSELNDFLEIMLAK